MSYKPVCLVTAPVATRSGYGAHSRDICRALIQLDNGIKIPSLNIKTTIPLVGTKVFAIGTPRKEQLMGTVTSGIISSERVLDDGLNYLQNCDLVFADPDNGLCDDDRYKCGQKASWKRIPLKEVSAVAKDRTAIIYHHNTRYKGGHEQEIRDWCDKLGSDTIALRWRARSNRTFFIINPKSDVISSAQEFCKDWGEKAEFFGNGN